MTAQQEPEHCGHECVCQDAIGMIKLGYREINQPCNYAEQYSPCIHDTRSRPHNPALAIISVEPHPPGKEQLACDNTCPARCPGCEDTCPLWEHDEQVKREAREEVLNKLKDDLKTRFVSSSNQWSNGRNSGLLECGNIIDDYLRSEVKKP